MLDQCFCMASSVHPINYHYMLLSRFHIASAWKFCRLMPYSLRHYGLCCDSLFIMFYVENLFSNQQLVFHYSYYWSVTEQWRVFCFYRHDFRPIVRHWRLWAVVIVVDKYKILQSASVSWQFLFCFSKLCFSFRCCSLALRCTLAPWRIL
jgi:hypothetical protein